MVKAFSSIGERFCGQTKSGADFLSYVLISKFFKSGVKRSTPLFRLIAVAVSCCVLETAISPDVFQVYAATRTVVPSLNFPYVPGKLLKSSESYTAPVIKGLRLDSDNPFVINFVIDGNQQESVSQADAMRMVKYFFTIVTTPEKDLWVNLSPTEKDRVMNDNLAATDLGRDMLLQDYLLKQLAASLTFPEDELGQKFWERVSAQVFAQYGDVNLPSNMISKVWIVPESATVYAFGDSAMILDAKLDVMTEEDYEARSAESLSDGNEMASVTNKIFKEIVLPEIKREINEGENFAPVRQMFHSLILGLWFKKNLKHNLINRIYSDRKIVDGIDIDDKDIKEKVYQDYLIAFEKGVYDFIQDEYDPQTQSIVPRQYFSGGIIWNSFAGAGRTWLQTVQDPLVLEHTIALNSPAMLSVELLPSGGSYAFLKKGLSKMSLIGLSALVSACFSVRKSQLFFVSKSVPSLKVGSVALNMSQWKLIEGLEAAIRDSFPKDNAQLSAFRNFFVSLLIFFSFLQSQMAFSQSTTQVSVDGQHKIEFLSKGDVIQAQDAEAIDLLLKVVTVDDVKGLDGKQNALNQNRETNIYHINPNDFQNLSGLFQTGKTIDWRAETVIITAQHKLGLAEDGDLGASTIKALKDYVKKHQQTPGSGALFSHSGGSRTVVTALPDGNGGAGSGGGAGAGTDHHVDVLNNNAVAGAAYLLNQQNNNDSTTTIRTNLSDTTRVSIVSPLDSANHRVIQINGQKFYKISDVKDTLDHVAKSFQTPPVAVNLQAPVQRSEQKPRWYVPQWTFAPSSFVKLETYHDATRHDSLSTLWKPDVMFKAEVSLLDGALRAGLAQKPDGGVSDVDRKLGATDQKSPMHQIFTAQFDPTKMPVWKWRMKNWSPTLNYAHYGLNFADENGQKQLGDIFFNDNDPWGVGIKNKITIPVDVKNKDKSKQSLVISPEAWMFHRWITQGKERQNIVSYHFGLNAEWGPFYLTEDLAYNPDYFGVEFWANNTVAGYKFKDLHFQHDAKRSILSKSAVFGGLGWGNNILSDGKKHDLAADVKNESRYNLIWDKPGQFVIGAQTTVLGAVQLKGTAGFNNGGGFQYFVLGANFTSDAFTQLSNGLFLPFIVSNQNVTSVGNKVYSWGTQQLGLKTGPVAFGVESMYGHEGIRQKSKALTLLGGVQNPRLFLATDGLSLTDQWSLHGGVHFNQSYGLTWDAGSSYEFGSKSNPWIIDATVHKITNPTEPVQHPMIGDVSFSGEKRLSSHVTLRGMAGVLVMDRVLYGRGKWEADFGKPSIFLETGAVNPLFKTINLWNPQPWRAGVGYDLKNGLGQAKFFIGFGPGQAPGYGVAMSVNLQSKNKPQAKTEETKSFLVDPLIVQKKQENALDSLPVGLAVKNWQELNLVNLAADTLMVSDLHPGMWVQVQWKISARGTDTTIQQIGKIIQIFNNQAGNVAVKYQPVYSANPLSDADAFIYFEAEQYSYVSALVPYGSNSGASTASITAVYENEHDAAAHLTLSDVKLPVDDTLSTMETDVGVNSVVVSKEPIKVSAMDRYQSSQKKTAQMNSFDNNLASNADVHRLESTQAQTQDTTESISSDRNSFDETAKNSEEKIDETLSLKKSQQAIMAVSNKKAVGWWIFTMISFVMAGLWVSSQKRTAKKYRAQFLSLRDLTDFTTELLKSKQSSVTLFSGLPTVSVRWMLPSQRVGDVAAQTFPIVGAIEERDGQMELHLIFQPDDIREKWNLTKTRAQRLPQAFGENGFMTASVNGKALTLKPQESKAGPHFVTVVFDLPSMDAEEIKSIVVERPVSLNNLDGEKVRHEIPLGMSEINALYYRGEILLGQGKTETLDAGYDQEIREHFKKYYDVFNLKHRNIFEDYGRTAEFADKVLRQAGDFLVLDAVAENRNLLTEETRTMLKEFVAFTRPLFDVASKHLGSIDAQKRMYFERGDTPHHKVRSVLGPFFENLSLTALWVSFYKQNILKVLPDIGFHKRRLDRIFGQEPDPRFTVNRLRSGFFTLLNWWQDPNVRSMGGLDAASRINRIVMDGVSMFMITVGLIYAQDFSWTGTLYVLGTFLAARVFFPLANVITIPVPFQDGFYSLAQALRGGLNQSRVSIAEMRREDSGLFDGGAIDRLLSRYSEIVDPEAFHSIRVQPKRAAFEVSLRSTGRIGKSAQTRIYALFKKDLEDGFLIFPGVDSHLIQINVHAFGVNLLLPYTEKKQNVKTVTIQIQNDQPISVVVERDALTGLMDALNELDEVLKTERVPENFDHLKRAIKVFYNKEIQDSLHRHHFRNNLAAYRKLRGKVDHVRTKLAELSQAQNNKKDLAIVQTLGLMSRHTYEVIRFYGEMASADVDKRLGYFRGMFYEALRKITFVKYFVERGVSQAYVAAENVGKVGAHQKFADHLIETNQKFDQKLMRPSPYIMLGEQYWRSMRRYFMMVVAIFVASVSLNGLVNAVFIFAVQGEWRWYGLNLGSIGGFYVLRTYFAIPLSGVYWVLKEYRESLKGFLKNRVIAGGSGSLIATVEGWIELGGYSMAIVLPWAFPVLALWQFVRYKMVDQKIERSQEGREMIEDNAQLVASSDVLKELNADSVTKKTGGIDFGKNLENIKIINGDQEMNPAQLSPVPVINLQHFQQFRFKILGFKQMDKPEVFARLGITFQPTQLSYKAQPSLAGM